MVPRWRHERRIGGCRIPNAFFITGKAKDHGQSRQAKEGTEKTQTTEKARPGQVNTFFAARRLPEGWWDALRSTWLALGTAPAEMAGQASDREGCLHAPRNDAHVVLADQNLLQDISFDAL